MQKRLEKIYKQQALAAMGHGTYGASLVGGAYHRKVGPKFHPEKHHMAGMSGTALMGPLAYSHPPHPYYHTGHHPMMHGMGAYVGGNVHHRHHPGYPGHVGEPRHPNSYAMFLKANYPTVRAALQGKLHGRELNKAIFAEIGAMWRSMGHK